MDIVRKGCASNNGRRAEGVRDTILARKLVEKTDNVGDHAGNDKFGKTLVGKAVSAGTKALLDCTDRALNLTDVGVGGDHVHRDGSDLVTDAFEFVIALDVMNNKTSQP